MARITAQSPYSTVEALTWRRRSFYSDHVEENNELEPEAVVDTPRTWTQAYRWPIALGSGVLGVVFVLFLTTGSANLVWVGIVGLALVIAWVIVFQLLYRRGY